MMAEAIQYMKLPNSTDRKQKFKDQIYITQVYLSIENSIDDYNDWQYSRIVWIALGKGNPYDSWVLSVIVGLDISRKSHSLVTQSTNSTVALRQVLGHKMTTQNTISYNLKRKTNQTCV